MAVDVQLVSLITQTGFAGLFVYLLIETRRTDAKLRDQLMADAARREAQLVADAKARETQLIADATRREAQLMSQLDHCGQRLENIGQTLIRLEKWLGRTDG